MNIAIGEGVTSAHAQRGNLSLSHQAETIDGMVSTFKGCRTRFKWAKRWMPRCVRPSLSISAG